MIEIKNLCKSYGNKEVLDDINLQVDNGSIVGLVGINGAGKSTLLRLISGVFKADKGTILIDGEEVYENEKIKQQIFFLPDEPFYSINTTPISLIDLYKSFYSLDKEAYLNYLNMFKIPLKKTMNTFSKGMKRQVFVSLALAIKPKYLLLDEAFDGLDPLARLSFKKALIDLVSDKKCSVIISSHSLRELEDICDYYALIDNKKIASSGQIATETEKLHKYQVVFNEMINKEDFNINLISFEQDKRVVRVVVNEELDEFSEKIKDLSPLIIDEIPIDFEELFIIEVERKGYLKWKTY